MKTRKKVISLLLAIVMTIGLMTTALADESITDCSGGEACTHVAAIGTTHYTSLAEAIAATPDSPTSSKQVDLLKSTTESVVIPSGKKIKLKVPTGVTLTNEAGKDTITVELGATLEFASGSAGKIDNVSHACAAIVNNGYTRIKYVTVERSKEAGVDKNDNGGNSYYTILNHGEMYIESGAKVNNIGGYSSLIANGYYNFGSTDPRNGYVEGTNQEVPKLIVFSSAVLDGGLNTVKNDDNGDLSLRSGTFKNYKQASVQNHNVAEIIGGTFEAEGVAAVYNHGCDADYDKGQLTITKGCFKGAITDASTEAAPDHFIKISGGYFTEEPSSKFLAEGKGIFASDKEDYKYTIGTKVAEYNGQYYTSLEAAINAIPADDTATVKLLQNAKVSEVTINDGKNLTINLNGFTINNIVQSKRMFLLRADGANKGGSLTLTGTGTLSGSTYANLFIVGNDDSSGTEGCAVTIGENIKISGGADSIWIDRNESSKLSRNVTVDIYGTLSANQPIYVHGNIEDEAENAPNINIHSGAKIECKNGVGIYLAGYAKTTIEDGAVLTCDKNVISIAAGELIVNGGTFTGGNTLDTSASSGGSINALHSCAIYAKQHTTNQKLNVTINGGSFSAARPLYQDNGESTTPAPEKVSLAVNDGTFTSTYPGDEENVVAIYSANKTGFITGGTFSTDPSAYVPTNTHRVVDTYRVIPATSFKVIFDANGGTCGTASAYSHELDFLPTATRSGSYSFNGWYTATSGGTKVTSASEITKDITLYAQWTYTGGSSSSGSSSGSNTTTTTENPDGSTTTTTTDKSTGTVTEVTKETDGTTTTVETKKDGTVTETVKTPEGTTGTVVTDKYGDVTEVTASVSSTAAKAAEKADEAVTLPVEVPAATNTDDAPAVEITVPRSVDSVKVEIPVEKVTPGTVAVIVHEDGTEEIVATSVVTEDGVALTLDSSATVKIIDNSKDFIDVPADNVFHDEISALSAREIMVGKTDDVFDLYNSVTLNQIANVAGRITGAVDVKDFNAGIVWGAENGLKTGNVAATRGDVLKALYIAAGSPVVEDTSILARFNDAASIPADMAAIAAWAAQNGILKGTDAGTADLSANVTRGQACALAGRAMGTLA